MTDKGFPFSEKDCSNFIDQVKETEMNRSISVTINNRPIEDLPNPQNFIPGFTKPKLHHEIRRAKSVSPLILRRSSLKEPTNHNINDEQIYGKSALLSASLPVLSVASPNAIETQLFPLICPKNSFKSQENISHVVRRVHSFSTSKTIYRPDSELLPEKIIKKEFPSQFQYKCSFQQANCKQRSSTML